MTEITEIQEINIKEEFEKINNKIDDIIYLLTKSNDLYSASYYITKHPETKYINKLLINKYNIPKERLELNKNIINN